MKYEQQVHPDCNERHSEHLKIAKVKAADVILD
jgi:hypothetical protein